MVVLVELFLLLEQLLLLLPGQRVLLVLVVEHARVVVSQLAVFGLEVVFEGSDAVLLLVRELPVSPFEFGVMCVLQVLEVLGVLGLLGFPQFSQLFLVLLPGQGVLLVFPVQSGRVVLSESRVLCILVFPESFQLVFLFRSELSVSVFEFGVMCVLQVLNILGMLSFIVLFQSFQIVFLLGYFNSVLTFCLLQCSFVFSLQVLVFLQMLYVLLFEC